MGLRGVYLGTLCRRSAASRERWATEGSPRVRAIIPRPKERSRILKKPSLAFGGDRAREGRCTGAYRKLLRLEQARQHALENPVHRNARLGLEVIINDNCYQQRSEADDQNKPRAKTRDDSSPLPRRSSNRSRNARTGSSHTFTQSRCATLLDVSSVSLGY